MTSRRLALLLFTLLLTLAPRISAAQTPPEERKDSLWNGTAIGLGLGATVGLFDLGPKGITWCRRGRGCLDEGVMSAVGNAAIGAAIDALVRHSSIVQPGMKIDDNVGGGALVGLTAGVAYGFQRAHSSCREPTGQPCSRGRRIKMVAKHALFGAALGALIDLAVPHRAPASASR